MQSRFVIACLSLFITAIGNAIGPAPPLFACMTHLMGASLMYAWNLLYVNAPALCLVGSLLHQDVMPSQLCHCTASLRCLVCMLRIVSSINHLRWCVCRAQCGLTVCVVYSSVECNPNKNIFIDR